MHLRKRIQRIGYKILKYVLPELSVLKKDICWDYYANFQHDSNFSSPQVRVTSPYDFGNVTIGDFSYVDRNSHIADTSIGKFCSIGPNFFCGWGLHPTNGLSTSPMFYSSKKQNGFTYSNVDKFEERKRIKIGNDVFIGANVTVIDGVTIGHGAIIGAGSVVSKDISPYAIAVGSPIKVIKYRFDDDQIAKLLSIKWWEFPDEKLSEVETMFFDVEEFIAKYINHE